MKRIVLLILVMLTTACATGPFVPVTETGYVNEKQGYNAELPVGWVRLNTAQVRNHLVISKDGYSLQSIQIKALKHDKAFEKTEQKVEMATPISDLAAFELAEFKAKNPNAASVQILSNTLEKVADQPAYKLHVQYLNNKGLRLEQLTYGFMHPDYYYKLTYSAPSLHYFQRDLAAFNQVVHTFKWNTKAEDAKAEGADAKQ